MKITQETLRAPHVIFIIYVAVGGILIMVFRFIFPGSPAPLLYFSREWRLIRGVLELYDWFPALALSALVVPYGIVSYDDYAPGFFPVFFKRLLVPVINAICAAALYGIIFFLLLPLARNYEEELIFKGDIYRLARERAQAHSRSGEWLEASQFLGICERVWPQSPEMASVRTDVEVHLNELDFVDEENREQAREALAGNLRSASVSAVPGQPQPLDASQAITMAEAAFAQGRYFDAHWLATIGERIAIPGSPEAARASRIAGNAWNAIDSQSPTRREANIYRLYELKRSGYLAMNSGDWIRAFYIFQELVALTPDDPDAVNFYAASEKGTREVAFFIDEMELSLGEILTGAIFSLPVPGGRAVLRFSSLSASEDSAYGIGFEYMGFDALSRPIANVHSQYAKLLPFDAGDGEHLLILLRALDRRDEGRRWDPEWTEGDSDIKIIVDISFDELLLLANVRRGLTNLQIDELYDASKNLGDTGYVHEVFEAEVLNRLGAVLFFLPMGIFSIIIGWRFRAKERPRYTFIPLLPILPVVFHGIVFLYRTVLNIVGIWLVMSLSYLTAIIVFCVSIAVIFFLSLILLAAQHG